MLLPLVVGASLALVLVALSREREPGERPLLTPAEAQRVEEVTRELDRMNLPIVGLGEFSPARVTLAGWRTNGERRLVPLTEFRPGGPGRDGIPALTRPRVVRVADVRHLEPEAPVIELVVGGEARAYPLVERVGQPQPKISNHLACLRWCGFVQARRDHRTVYNRIADDRVLALLELGHALLSDNAEHVAACCRIEERD